MGTLVEILIILGIALAGLFVLMTVLPDWFIGCDDDCDDDNF